MMFVTDRRFAAAATSTLVGILAGTAIAGPYGDASTWRWTSAGGLIGLSVAMICLGGLRVGFAWPVAVLASAAVAAVEGFAFARVMLRGGQDNLDAMLGRTVMAMLLGMACALTVGLLLDWRESRPHGRDQP